MIFYYAIHNDWVDRKFTGDVHQPLPQLKQHIQQTTQTVTQALEQGSTYNGYKNPTAKPSLQYEIVDWLEVLTLCPPIINGDIRSP